MISLLVPTRHRRKQFEKFAKSARAKADAPKNVEIVCYTDVDDDSYADLNLTVTRIVGERDYKNMWNRCAEHAKGDILALLGDDVLFRTKGWDSRIEEEFVKYDDKILLAFGKDGNEWQRDKPYGTHPFIHRRWVDAVGYFVPPYFSADMIDTWLNDVAEAIGRSVFIPEIFMEHMHVGFGKAKMDDVYADKSAKHEEDKPGPLYYTAKMEALRKIDADKLRAVMV